MVRCFLSLCVLGLLACSKRQGGEPIAAPSAPKVVEREPRDSKDPSEAGFAIRDQLGPFYCPALSAQGVGWRCFREIGECRDFLSRACNGSEDLEQTWCDKKCFRFDRAHCRVASRLSEGELQRPQEECFGSEPICRPDFDNTGTKVIQQCQELNSTNWVRPSADDSRR